MTNKLTMLLKTTAAVATLMVGSQSWAATLHDAAGVDQKAADISVTGNAFAAYTAEGAVTVAYVGAGGGMTVANGGTLMLYLSPDVTTSLTYADPLVLNSNASLYLIKGSPVGIFDLSGAVVSSPINAVATGVKIYLTSATTLPDMSAMEGTTLHILNSLALTGVLAGFGGSIDISEGRALTPVTWTACGGLLGKGTLIAANTNLTVNGDVSGDLTLNLTGMTTAARALVVTGDFATTKAFTSVPGSGADGTTSIAGDMVLGATFTTAGAGVTVSAGNLSAAGLTTVSALAPLVVTAGNASFSALTANAAVTVTAGDATFAGAVSAAHANAEITVGRDATFSATYSSVTGANLVVARNAVFSGVVSSTGAIAVTGDATFSAAATANNTVTIGGNAVFTGNVIANATAAMSVAGDAAFSGTLTTNASAPLVIDGNAVFSGLVTAGGALTVEGNAAFDGNVVAAGALSIDGDIKFAGDVAANGGLTAVGNVVFEGDLAVGAAEVLSIAGSVNLKGDLTAGASSQIILPGAISGAGSINLSPITAGIPSFGDASAFTGSVVLGSQPVVFAKAPASVFTGHQNNVTFTNGGTVARMVAAGINAKVTGGTTGGDVIIAEYELPNAFAATFVPGAGKKMTVTALSQHSVADEAITVSASTGTMVFKSNIKAGGSAVHTFSAPTSIAKYTVLAGAAPVITINENVTMDELDISAAGVTFVVADGKTLTVKKVVGNGNVTVNGAGTLSAKLPASYTGNVVTGGTAKLK